MKKLKFIIKYGVTFSFLVSSFFIVHAQTNVKIISNSSVTVGSTITITMEGGVNQSYDLKLAYDKSAFQFTSGDNCNESGSSVVCLISGNATKVDRAQATLKALKAGNSKVTVTGSGSSLSDFSKFSVSASKTIKINEKTPTKPTTPSVDSDKDKYPSAEEKAALELEIKRQTPLVKSISIRSLSDKFFEEELTNIKTEKEVFTYKYQLPTRIDKFEVVLEPLNDKVKITGETVYQFEADLLTKTLNFTLKDGQIEQVLALKVDLTVTDYKTITAFGKSYYLYDDELLDGYLKNFGFSKITKLNEETLEHYYFENEIHKLRLLIDQDKNARWFELDDNLNPIQEVVFYPNQYEYLLLPLTKLDETFPIGGNKYQLLSLKLPEALLKLDSSLKFYDELWGWDLEEYLILSGENHKSSGYFAVNQDLIEKAVVVFDESPNMTPIFTFLIGSNVLSLGLLLVYYLRQRRLKNLTLSARELRKKLAE